MKHLGAFISLKISRIITLLLFRSLKSGKNYLGSYISPVEQSAAHDVSLSTDALKIVDFLKVKAVADARVSSFGSVEDGGYFLVDDIVPKSVVISGGIETNNDFEYQLGLRGCTVIQIDYSVDEAPLKHPNLTFLKKKIVSVPVSQNEINLDSLVDQNWDALNNKNVRKILKLDIEGSEWDALLNFNKLVLFDQIVLELHYFQRCLDKKFRIQVLEVLANIHSSHQSIQLSGNNCCGFSILGGVPIPNVLEVTFASRERYSFTGLNNLSESGLNSISNYSDRAPLFLGGFH